MGNSIELELKLDARTLWRYRCHSILRVYDVVETNESNLFAKWSVAANGSSRYVILSARLKLYEINLEDKS